MTEDERQEQFEYDVTKAADVLVRIETEPDFSDAIKDLLRQRYEALTVLIDIMDLDEDLDLDLDEDFVDGDEVEDEDPCDTCEYAGDPPACSTADDCLIEDEEDEWDEDEDEDEMEDDDGCDTGS